MAWGRSAEERQQEQEAREAANRAAATAQAEQQRALEAQRQAEASATSPVGRATAAFARGDRFFQVELEVSALTGYASSFGSSANQITPREGTADVLGGIEAVGWHLEHAGFVFIETGATSTARMFATGEGTVTEGVVTGVYVFRRAQPQD